MRIIVVYQSKTGHTEEYAKLLASTLNCSISENKKFDHKTAKDYDYVIFLGWLRAAKIVGLNGFLRKVDCSNRLIIGAVGASPKTDQYTEKVLNKNFASKTSYPLYYLQGGFDPERLSFPLRIMMKKVADSLKKKQEKEPESLTEEDREFLAFFQTKHSDVSLENLKDLLDYLQE